MIAAVLLLWFGYLALGIYCARRAWQAARVLPAPWMRRLATSLVLAVFFAPSLIPAGHGVAPGPAWIAGAVWHEVRHLPQAMLLPMGVTALIFFALATLIRWLRGSPPAAQPAAPLGRGEALATTLLLALPVAGFAGMWVAQTAALRAERSALDAQFLGEAQASADAEAKGAWNTGSANGPPVLYLPSPSDLDSGGVTLARVPATGEVIVAAAPGTLRPGTPVMIRDGTGKPIGGASADANGAFEARVHATQGSYLRVVPVEIVRSRSVIGVSQQAPAAAVAPDQVSPTP